MIILYWGRQGWRSWPQAPQAQNTWCMRQLVYIENCMGKSRLFCALNWSTTLIKTQFLVAKKHHCFFRHTFIIIVVQQQIVVVFWHILLVVVSFDRINPISEPFRKLSSFRGTVGWSLGRFCVVFVVKVMEPTKNQSYDSTYITLGEKVARLSGTLMEILSGRKYRVSTIIPEERAFSCSEFEQTELCNLHVRLKRD